MSFNPKEHMIKMGGNDYLEVKWRTVWFRDEHPTGLIDTELLHYEDGFALVKATISIKGNAIATGTASADSRKKKAMWTGKEVMKAETAAIGRALAHAGYGTQFTGENEGDFLADSPVVAPPKKWATKNTVGPIMEKFREQGLSDSEVFQLAGVSAMNDGDGWAQYESADSAIKEISEALDNAVDKEANGDRPAVYKCEFNHMNYNVSGGKYLAFANCNPVDWKAGQPTPTIARAYARSTKVKDMIGEAVYNDLKLSQFDGAKHTTKFEPMASPLEFEYIEETTKAGETYLKIIGVVNVDF